VTLSYGLVVWAAGMAMTCAADVRAEEPIAPIPLTVSVDPARAALGARLFRETRLSRNNSVSCASCHPLDRGGTSGIWPPQPLAPGSNIERDTPTIFNVGLNIAYNWDGSGRSLEDVVDAVVRSPVRFNNEWPRIVSTLRSERVYAKGFEAAYPDGLTAANLRDALVHYQRSLITPNSRFDKYLRGDRSALTTEEQAGYTLFKSFGCAACHQGVNVGGNLFQKFGIFRAVGPGPRPQEGGDVGRFGVTQVERDRGVFRVPSLRNVELTAPYFHDGRAPTLPDAVRTMARVQLDRELGPQETQAIVQFLLTLTGELDGRPLRPPASDPQAQRGPAR